MKAPVYAAIDIGSNTTHVVVARCTAHDLDILKDEVTMVRLGESVDESGEISPELQEKALQVLQHYKELAEQEQAEQILAVATEAIRKARNGEEFLKQIQEKTGLQVQILSGEAEAVLTFYGATYEMANEPGAPKEVAVTDVGGGSTELITAKQQRITWRTSLHIGSGQMHDRFLHSNPPTYDEQEKARAFLRSSLQDAHIPDSPPLLIATGSSAASLLQLSKEAFGLDTHRDTLTREDLLLCEGLLSALPAEEVAQRYKQDLERARILPGGALILEEVMKAFSLEELRVTLHGVREGVLLAYERDGEQWLEKVNEVAQQQAVSSKGKQSNKDIQGQTFAEFGKEILADYAKKFLKWPDEILKHQDTEPVHKMRVASRRLRAALDAFESCCKPKLFKKVNSQVKKLADLLGAVRDSDVMLQGLHARLEQVPGDEQDGIQWLIDRLNTYHKERQQALDDALHALDENAFKKQISSCIKKSALRH